MNIQKYIRKYLLIIIGIGLLRVLVNYFVPDLFTVTTAIGDVIVNTKSTLIGIYQHNIFNVITSVFISIDLYKLKENLFLIPILTIISLPIGLFFFAVIILNRLIANYEQS